MNWLEIIVLPLIQGIAEFLPISSSGHLVIAEAVLGQPPNSTYNILLHGGTLASILIFYHRKILDLLRQDRRVMLLLIVGTLPAAMIGIAIKLSFEEVLEKPLVAACLLPVTGLVVWWSNRRPDGEGTYRHLTFRKTLLIGLFQSFALLPGLSRSGLTIAAGLSLGLRRDQATTFSFLLAIPAILGAMVLGCKDFLTGAAAPVTVEQIIGTVIAAIVGVFALAWLHRWVTQRRLHWFAFWCIPSGIVMALLRPWP